MRLQQSIGPPRRRVVAFDRTTIPIRSENGSRQPWPRPRSRPPSSAAAPTASLASVRRRRCRRLRSADHRPARIVSRSSMSLQWTLSSLLLCLLLATNALALDRVHEFQRYDGWFNNLANPEWGSVGSRLHRHVPSDYYDGVYMMDDHRPSARAISDLVFKGPSGLANPRNATTMLAFFSQVVAYEILQATQISCPLEMHKIPVTKCDPVFDRDCEGQTMIPFTRAKYDMDTGRGFNVPREQLNDKTSWIDASFLYSTQEPWVAELRSWENGTLSEGPMPGYPPFNANRIPLINPPPPQIHRLMDPERLYCALLLFSVAASEEPKMFAQLMKLFDYDVGKLDLYVGGMMEAPGDRPGELFSKIIKDQFQRIRDSDRFWYENRLNGLFTDEELEAINNITLYDIIRQTTDIGDDQLQKNLFFWREGDPCGQPFQVNTTGMEACIPFMRFDHFMGNEFTYIFTCIGLATIPIICIGIGYWLIQRRKRMGGEFVLETCHKHKKKSQENNNNIMNVFSVEKDSSKVKDKRFKINAIEWLHENYCRSVTVCVEPTPALRLEKPRGGLLRLIDLADVRTLVATVSDMSMRTGSGGPFVLLTLLKDHDMACASLRSL
uniref:Uncharacterized protein n=1 Tax=Plectus sambesii TaxID=2011161 RepID=A0A914V6A1_9BILA